MDFNDIKRLVKLVESSNIEELEIEEEGYQIRVTKSRGSGMMPVQPQMQMIQAPASPASAAVSTPVNPAAPAPVASDSADEVKSPMVGTFYRASAPDAAPFVKEGDVVKVGQTLCIIEAMKLMNEIEAEVSGKVMKILVENAQPVEFGQTLFLIEKA